MASAFPFVAFGGHEEDDQPEPEEDAHRAAHGRAEITLEAGLDAVGIGGAETGKVKPDAGEQHSTSAMPSNVRVL